MEPLTINALVAIAVVLFFMIQGALYYLKLKTKIRFSSTVVTFKVKNTRCPLLLLPHH